MNQIFKKPFIAAAAILAVTVLVLSVYLSIISQNDSLLINYIPQNAEFWFWRNRELTKEAIVFLKQAGVPETALYKSSVQESEIIVYKQRTRWYKLERDGDKLNTQTRSIYNDFWKSLYRGKEDIIGFFDSSYIDKMTLQKFALNQLKQPYFFILKQEQGLLYFDIMPKDKIASFTISLPSLSNTLTFPSSVFLAIRLKDETFRASVVQEIAKNIRQSLMFRYPVIVSKILPDNSTAYEKVVKPELFIWSNIAPFLHQLSLDDKKVQEYNVADQLRDVDLKINYYLEGSVVIFGSNQEELPASATLLQQIDGEILYFDAIAAYIPIVDIFGKNNVLSNLQELSIKRIFITENKDGIMYGEIQL